MAETKLTMSVAPVLKSGSFLTIIPHIAPPTDKDLNAMLSATADKYSIGEEESLPSLAVLPTLAAPDKGKTAEGKSCWFRSSLLGLTMLRQLQQCDLVAFLEELKLVQKFDEFFRLGRLSAWRFYGLVGYQR